MFIMCNLLYTFKNKFYQEKPFLKKNHNIPSLISFFERITVKHSLLFKIWTSCQKNEQVFKLKIFGFMKKKNTDHCYFSNLSQNQRKLHHSSAPVLGPSLNPLELWNTESSPGMTFLHSEDRWFTMDNQHR